MEEGTRSPYSSDNDSPRRPARVPLYSPGVFWCLYSPFGQGLPAQEQHSLGVQAVHIDGTQNATDCWEEGSRSMTSSDDICSSEYLHYNLCADCSNFTHSAPLAHFIKKKKGETLPESPPEDEEVSAEAWLYTKSEEDLHRSAQDGCGLCAQFVQSASKALMLEQVWPQLTEEAEVRGLIDPETFDGGFMVMEPGYPRDPKGTKILKLFFLVTWEFGYLKYKRYATSYSVTLIPAAKKALRYDSPTPNISTVDAMPLCSRWLRECSLLHKSCRSETVPPLPTRLLSIASEDCRLCLKEEIDPNVRYASLSHCWGAVDFETLQKSNLEEFRRKIPDAALSTTLRHAIQIAKYLGMRYIWIDSLCIIQDDADDWDRESRMMLDVYGGSFINIAASSSKDGTGGCFYRRSSTWRSQLTKQSKDGSTLYDCVRDEFPLRRIEIRHKAPLYTRGWVVQERYMSPRTVHFFQEQLFWDCTEKMYCETFPDGDTWGILNRNSIFGRKSVIDKLDWERVVEEFGAAKLTKSSDRLIAISGLAHKVHKNVSDAYIAGLWRQGLEDSLYWYHPIDPLGGDLDAALHWHEIYTKKGYGTLDPEKAMFLAHGDEEVEDVRSATSRVAPTWSWASIETSVTVHSRPNTAVASHHAARHEHVWGDLCVEVCDIDPNLINNFGPVVHGVLRLRCDYLCPGVVKRSINPSWHVMTLAHSDIAINITTGWGDQYAIPQILLKAFKIQRARRAPFPVFLLPLRLGVSSSKGLILVPCVHGRGRFQRVGSYCSATANSSIRAPGVFRQMCERALSSTREEDFAKILYGPTGNAERFIDIE